MLSFSIVLLLYLFYLPDEEKKKPRNLLLPLPCVLLASLSTGIFFVVYVFYLVLVVLQWHRVTVANRTMGIVIATAFVPFFISAILKNLLHFDNDLLLLVTEHGTFSRWHTSRSFIHSSYSLLLYSIPLLALIPRVSKKIPFHPYSHALCLSLVFGGIFLGPNFVSILLILNSMALKRGLIDGYLFKDSTVISHFSEGGGRSYFHRKAYRYANDRILPP